MGLSTKGALNVRVCKREHINRGGVVLRDYACYGALDKRSVECEGVLRD